MIPAVSRERETAVWELADNRYNRSEVGSVMRRRRPLARNALYSRKEHPVAESHSNKDPRDGRSRLPEFHVWKDARKIANRRQRQGIDLRCCKGWDRFQQFYLDLGPRPSPNHSLCRIDKSGHFSCGHCEECKANRWPLNCEWAIWIEDCQRRNNVVALTHDGLTLSISEWARRLGIDPGVIQTRLDRGWSTADALTKPVDGVANQPLRVPDEMLPGLLAEYTSGKTLGQLSEETGFGRQAIRSAVVRAGAVIRQEGFIRRGIYVPKEQLVSDAKLDTTLPDRPFEDLIGKTFGKLTVVSYAGRSHNRGGTIVHWFCTCDCGGSTLARSNNLKNGQHASCGCYRSQQARHPLYHVWNSVIRRCNTDVMYINRGVCERLRTFSEFISAVGNRPDGMSLDRIDNSKGYFCGECEECKQEHRERNIRWATKETQANNRSNNVRITARGETHTAAEWARKLGVRQQLIQTRIRLGWSVDDALFLPVQRNGRAREKLG